MCFETECGMVKVVFGTTRTRVCDFLLVISSNLGPTLPRFRDIAGFLLRRATPPLFHPNFRDILLGLIADVVAARSDDPKLITVINFELVQPICSRYINVTDGQTNRRTTYDSNTALALPALRGKNR